MSFFDLINLKIKENKMRKINGKIFQISLIIV